MKDYARGFYNTKIWQETRNAYVKHCGGLCERCLERGIINAGVIVHHKIYLTPQNITNPDIALNFDNLELLCRQCHSDEHGGNEPKRYTIGKDGSVIVT